jgi:2-iminobutanoate/2-iminopropanoate deaminase
MWALSCLTLRKDSRTRSRLAGQGGGSTFLATWVFGESGQIVSGGLGAEARATFDNIERVLTGLGANLSHVVKITAFVTDLSDYAAYAGGVLPA